jgi:hypothetical protein
MHAYRPVLPLADGKLLGPAPLDLMSQMHSARVFARAVIDLALGRRDEESRDFVGVACRFVCVRMFCMRMCVYV